MSQKTILVVDDDKDIRESLADVLETYGFAILNAQNGEEALTLLSSLEKPPLLILLDLMMPVLDGLGFRERQLKDDRLRNIPTVLISASGQLEKRCASVRFDRIIKKPLDLDDLMAVIDDIESRHS